MIPITVRDSINPAGPPRSCQFCLYLAPVACEGERNERDRSKAERCRSRRCKHRTKLDSNQIGDEAGYQTYFNALCNNNDLFGTFFPRQVSVLFGRQVTLIEGEKNVGGNSAKASSGINGCGTETQKRLHIEDNTTLFFGDTMTAGDKVNLASLVEILVGDSKEAIEWLIEKGVDLANINILGGHSVPRTHWYVLGLKTWL